MAYAIVHHFPGRTKDQYEKSLAAVHPSKSNLPAGQIFHAAGPSAGGSTIMAVHDSKKSWEQFRDQILMPRMKQGIEGGLIGPPQETAFEVHNLQTGDQLTYTVPAFSGGGTAVATWKRATSRKHRAAGSVVDFVAEETAPAEESVGLGSDELHQQYVRWCREKGSEGLPREAFVEEFDRLRELSALRGKIRKFGSRYFGIALARSQGYAMVADIVQDCE